MKYVALLRGINVGGNNKVSMTDLRLAMEQSGFLDVTTYINSGNVLFSSDEQDIQMLRTTCERIIRNCSGVTTTALVISEQKFVSIAKAIDPKATNDSQMRCDVLFLWDAIDQAQIINQLPLRPAIDTVTYVPGAIIWSIDRQNVTRSGLSKMIGTTLYTQMTIRNCNTVRKLAALLETT